MAEQVKPQNAPPPLLDLTREMREQAIDRRMRCCRIVFNLGPYREQRSTAFFRGHQSIRVMIHDAVSDSQLLVLLVQFMGSAINYLPR
ncbi:MAG: hypothetical protein OXI70_15640, partial [Chloroflexota bacterium]|nr:hypothetical protein [Chloroflexota bacterium]